MQIQRPGPADYVAHPTSSLSVTYAYAYAYAYDVARPRALAVRPTP